MPFKPANDLRNNIASWAVQPCAIPAVVARMLDQLPTEDFDPSFGGQYLQTTYFDTFGQDLRKARIPKQRYLTLRIRAYTPSCPAGGKYPDPVYALSAKTEDKKFRVEVPQSTAEALLKNADVELFGNVLSPELFARLLELLPADATLLPSVTCTAQRYAVEDNSNRFTLDINVATDTGKKLVFNVLEFKSADPQTPPPPALPGMRPIKISKFLWATSPDGR
jgi:hypothetical protein